MPGSYFEGKCVYIRGNNVAWMDLNNVVVVGLRKMCGKNDTCRKPLDCMVLSAKPPVRLLVSNNGISM